jgi:acyl-CoA synthetase (AMP-forming)/AMP-acid ligase II
VTALLQAEGLAPGDRAVIQVPPGPEFAAAVLGVLLAGGVPVLCEPGLGDAVYLGRLAAAAPEFLLRHPLVTGLGKIPHARAWLAGREVDVPPTPPRSMGLTRVPITAAAVGRLARRGPSPTIVERDPGDDAFLVFTGGTTTAPKGVRLSHGALDRYLANISSLIDGETGKTFVADTPQQMLYALRLGWPVHLSRGRKEKRARHLLSLLTRETVDAYFSSPFVWSALMDLTGDRRPWAGANPRRVLLGSAPVTPAFLRRLRAYLDPATRIQIVYGLTECGPACALSAEEKLAFAEPGDVVGAPLPGIELTIVGARPDGVGEVVIRAPSLFTGYLGESDRAPGDGLATGDLGRIATVGGRPMLVLMGRAKDMIVRDGVNIYPASFEPQVRALVGIGGRPLVAECAMIGVWDEAAADERVVLCVQPARGTTLDVERLRALATRIAGPGAAPDHVLVVDEIPVTGRQNKVDKNALRRLAAGRLAAGRPGLGKP